MVVGSYAEQEIINGSLDIDLSPCLESYASPFGYTVSMNLRPGMVHNSYFYVIQI